MEVVCAAQYFRVSTERQEYSLDCQIAGIANYAKEHGFEVRQTYCDEARSELEISRTAGLSQLLQDVVGEKQSFGAVLVYDVSRWGRFQDPDEAAHYEFLCKAAGVRVHYKKTSANRLQVCRIRTELMRRLVEMFPGKVSVFSWTWKRRNCLRLKNGTKVAVRVCGSIHLVTK